jgi:hypothetical protein
VKAIVLVIILARAAHATGVCENTEPRFDPPELFDETTQSFAVQGSQPWCDEVQDGGAIDEARGAVSFVMLRDVHDKVLGILSTAQGDDAKHLTAMVGKFEAVPLGKLHATLLKRGYKPLAQRAKDCKLATAWTDIAPPGGWRDATLQLDVKIGSKQLSRTRLGTGSIERRGDQFVRAHVLRQQLAIAVFAIVPSCAGPPPGYFGPDDGGMCYRVDRPLAFLLEARNTPALAACF